MAPPSAVAADKVVSPFADPDPSDQVAAMDRQTVAIQALVTELTATRLAFTPAAEAIHGLGDAQAKFCAFLVGNRLKLTASIPVVLVAVGAISPNAANVIGAILKAWGLQ